MATVELRFTPLPEHVRTARLIAATVGRRSGVPDILLDEVKLAAGEACARAVSVHRRNAPRELVLVRLIDGETSFTVQVADCGPPGEDVPPIHDGEPVSATELLRRDVPGARRPRSEPVASLPTGIGLAILEGLVDDVEIRPRADGTGTVVTMCWRLPRPDDDVAFGDSCRDPDKADV